MTQLQIKYFLHVATTKSISQSAEALYVSPPAISKQITMMEQELELKLFERSARGMELTPAGQVMFNYYFNQDSAFLHALHQAKGVSAQEGVTLHFGFMTDWVIQPQVMRLRRLLREHHIPINLVPHCCFDPSNPQRLERGELDAALCIGDDLFVAARGADLRITPVTAIRKVLLFASFLPQAQRPDLSTADFADMPLLTLSPSLRPNAQYDNLRLCNSLGFNPQVIVKDTLEEAFFSASIGEGFMIGDEWLCRCRLPEHAYLPLQEKHIIYLISSARNQNPAIPVLTQLCEQEINWNISLSP